jgi:hypothetical protein
MSDERSRKLALAILLFNITLMMAGILGYAWHAYQQASRELGPTHNAQQLQR